MVAYTMRRTKRGDQKEREGKKETLAKDDNKTSGHGSPKSVKDKSCRKKEKKADYSHDQKEKRSKR